MAEFQDSIEIEAPPQAVFEYLTTNKGMTAWMGQYADLDPTPGGRFAVDIAGYPVRGGASKVEFILTPITGGTRVDLRHLNLPESEVRGHAHGWAHFMPRLKVAGAGGDAGPDHWQPLTD